jgi:hypothetical protein
MSHMQIVEERADEKIRAMLNAFAGHGEPISSLRPRRSPSRRTLVVATATLLALGLAVPGALALLGVLSETPQQFISDSNQPFNARNAIAQYIERTRGRTATLIDVRQVVTADTPDGPYNVYALGFAGGLQGTAVISSRTGGIAALGYGPPVACPAGWALQGGISTVELPGKTPLYMTGRTSDAVASLDVLYPDGHSSPAAVSNGFFLAWVTPLPGGPNGKGFSPTVTLIARNATGAEIGRLTVRGDGDIPPSPGQARQAVPCG